MNTANMTELLNEYEGLTKCLQAATKAMVEGILEGNVSQDGSSLRARCDAIVAEMNRVRNMIRVLEEEDEEEDEDEDVCEICQVQPCGDYEDGLCDDCAELVCFTNCELCDQRISMAHYEGYPPGYYHDIHDKDHNLYNYRNDNLALCEACLNNYKEQCAEYDADDEEARVMRSERGDTDPKTDIHNNNTIPLWVCC